MMIISTKRTINIIQYFYAGCIATNDNHLYKVWSVSALLLQIYTTEKVDGRYYIKTDVFTDHRTPCHLPNITMHSRIRQVNKNPTNFKNEAYRDGIKRKGDEVQMRCSTCFTHDFHIVSVVTFLESRRSGS